MATAALWEGSQTATLTTEHSLHTVIVAGVFQLVVDTNAMAAGDTLCLRVKQMTRASGTARVLYEMRWYGAQPAWDLIKASVPIINPLTDAGALDFTLQQDLGTGRAYPWSINQVG